MTDPYRTLGLAPGAPMAEVKRAYRQLAKAYHPDSAGEAALPRFLAIHEAYEAIRTGRPMAPGRRSAAPTPASEAWRADPERARAAREQARRRAGTRSAGGAGSAGTAAGAGTGTGARAGAGSTTGSRAGAGPGARAGTGGRPSGSSGGAGRSDSGGGRTGTSGRAGSGRSGRRHVRKATMGSTSYDEARDPTDPNDPTWSGASWYGPSTGEYWIINPREYADPRKHGPEYQSRARRMAAAAAAGENLDDASIDVESDAAIGAQEPPAAEREATWTSRPATSRAARPPGAARVATRSRQSPARPAAASPTWGTPGPVDGPSLRRGDLGARVSSPRDWIGGAADDPIRRLGIALVAWPPLGLAAATLIGDVTGCAVFSADCGGTEPLLPWLAQAVILGLLLLLPAMARLLAGGAVGVLVAVVPLTAFLVAVGGTGAPQAGFALSFLLALAWLAGLGWAIATTRRRGADARAAT